MPTQPTDERVEKVVKEFAKRCDDPLKEGEKRGDWLRIHLTTLLADCEARVREEVEKLAEFRCTDISYAEGYHMACHNFKKALDRIKILSAEIAIK